MILADAIEAFPIGSKVCFYDPAHPYDYDLVEDEVVSDPYLAGGPDTAKVQTRNHGGIDCEVFMLDATQILWLRRRIAELERDLQIAQGGGR